MNPMGVLIAVIGVVLIIAGVKGSYANIETALTGKRHAPAAAGQTTATGQNTPGSVMVPNKPVQTV